MELNSPQSELKNRIKKWWDDPTQDYDGFIGHGVNSEIEKELWGNEILHLLRYIQNPKILDIGSGTGFLALLLARMGCEITAVDWSMTMMQKAKEKAKAAQIPIQFKVQDAEDLTFQDASFDAVVSRHVLWTLSNPSKAVREWVRVTKPGGFVITDIPRIGSHSGKHHYGDGLGEQLPLGNGAEPEEIATIFKEAGLSDVNIKIMEKQKEQHRKTILIYGEKR